MRNIAQIFALVLLSAAAAFAQDAPSKNLDLPNADEIIRKFSANEARFREALKEYVFNRNATVNTIGMGGQITGTYRRDSFMTFNQAGERFERIVFFPVSTVEPGTVTPEDLEDLGGVNAFALEPSAIDKYKFTLVGSERIDDLDLYVFDVAPKVIPDPKKTKLRLFTGRIWIDKDDLMIVKAKGKGVPESKNNKFPIVETWRENIDGKYWFPSYAAADDELVFDNGTVLRIRMKVRFTNYRLGRTDVRILDDPTPTPTPIKP